MKHLKISILLICLLATSFLHAQDKKSSDTDATEWSKAKHKANKEDKSLHQAQRKAHHAKRSEMRQKIQDIRNDDQLSGDEKTSKVKEVMDAMADHRSALKQDRIDRSDKNMEERKQMMLERLENRSDLSDDEKEKRTAKMEQRVEKKLERKMQKLEKAEAKASMNQEKKLFRLEKEQLEKEWDTLSEEEKAAKQKALDSKKEGLKQKRKSERSSQLESRITKMTEDLNRKKAEGKITTDQYETKMKHIEKMKSRLNKDL